jgi:hypothetical protein
MPAFGCSSGGSEPEGAAGGLAALEPVEGCDEVAAALREQAIEEMEQRA